jgi:TRAP-type C4-dicarboxylate transport system permease small subunit
MHSGEPGPLQRVERGVVRAVELLTVVGGAVIVGSLIVGVFFRYVLRDSLSWTDEAAMFCFSWIVLLAAALLVREGGHVRVELIESHVPTWAARALRSFIDLLILLTGIYLAWTGWDFMMLTEGQLSPAIRYPIWTRNLSLPVSGLLISVFALSNLLRRENAASGVVDR